MKIDWAVATLAALHYAAAASSIESNKTQTSAEPMAQIQSSNAVAPGMEVTENSDLIYQGDDDDEIQLGDMQMYDAEYNYTLPKGTLKFDVKRVGYPLAKDNQQQVSPLGPPVVRRAAQQFTDRLQNQRFYYSTNVEIGTPGQQVELLVDTGSSDTWVFSPTTRSRGKKPVARSVFDPTRSRTFRSNGTQWKIQYGIGSSGGQWGTDNFKIGGVTVKSLSIGIADQADVAQGIIGIGRQQAESHYKGTKPYENLPLKLASQGLINTAAYSLYLNDLNAKAGTLLFGAVDHSKYTGVLFALPVIHPVHLGITMQGMQTDGLARGNILPKPITAVLDSGTSLTYMQKEHLNTLHEAVNANPSFAIGEKYYCDCNVTKNMIMDFGGVKINVPAYHFLWPIETVVNPIVANIAFPPNSCYIGIEETQKNMDFLLIGDNFLRAMYIVYDLTHNKIAVAQANLAGGTPQIEVIKDHIPGAVGG